MKDNLILTHDIILKLRIKRLYKALNSEWQLAFKVKLNKKINCQLKVKIFILKMK